MPTERRQESRNGLAENASSSANDSEHFRGEKNENEGRENEMRLKPASSRDLLSPLNEPSNDAGNENHVTKEKKDLENVSNGGADVTVPGLSENENSENHSSPRGWKNILRANRTHNFTEEYRYWSDKKIKVPRGSFWQAGLFFLGLI